MLVVIGWFTFGAKVMKLRSEAKKLVAQSSEETFKASQTSIVYDTNGKQLLKFKGEKDVYYLSDCPGIAQKVLSVFVQREAM